MNREEDIEQNMDFILNCLNMGKSASYIYRSLRTEGKVRVKDRVFKRYVSELKKGYGFGQPEKVENTFSQNSLSKSHSLTNQPITDDDESVSHRLSDDEMSRQLGLLVDKSFE